MKLFNEHNDTNDSNVKYKEIFNAYYAPLIGFAQSYLKDRSEAEDIVQDTFMKLWKIRDRIDSNLNIKSLVFTATKNKCISALRTRKCHGKYQDKTEAELLLQSQRSELALQYSTITEIELDELQEQIETILNQLPEDHRMIFQKNRVDGKSYVEIADELNISVKTVEKKISKTLKIFRKNLSDYNYSLFSIM